MKEKFANISKRTLVRVVLVTILFIIVAFGFAGEKVALGPGIGWDGENYLRSMQHFIYLIRSHGYDQYAIMRVMPWGLTDILSAIFDFSVTREVAISFGIIYNAIAIITSVIYYFRISNYKQWKLATEILGFSFLFFIYPILKMMGYYPVASDIFGLSIGIMMCYYFIINKRWALIVCGLIGTFVWPTTPLVAFALAFFPRKALPIVSPLDTMLDRRVKQGLFVLISAIPLIILVLVVMQYNGHIMTAMRDICPLTVPIVKWIIPLTCACSCAYYYYMVSKFNVSLSEMLKENFTGKNNWVNYGLFVLFIMLTSGVSRFLANAEPGALTTMQTLRCIAITSMTDPFVFVECHFICYGIGYILVLIHWRQVAQVIMQQGLGYLFAVAMWVLFSIRPEARVSIMYYIFPLMALLMYLDTKEIRPYAVGICAGSMMALSRFWYHINVPNMEKYLAWDMSDEYISFPAQRFFMSQGHWQSHEMYAVWMTITIIVGVVLYAGIRKKWFVNND